MKNDNMTVIKEVQGLTKKESYVIGSHFVRYYGKTECFLNIRLDEIIDTKQIFTSEHNYNSHIKDYFIDNVLLAVTYCGADSYNRRTGQYKGVKHCFAIELFFTEHNRYFQVEDNKRVFIPKQNKKMLLSPIHYKSKKEGVKKINELLFKIFNIENLMYDNKYNNKLVFDKIVELCKENEKYGTVHKNFLPYQVWLYECTLGRCMEKLLEAEFITINEKGWIKPTKKGLARLEAIKQGQ